MRAESVVAISSEPSAQRRRLASSRRAAWSKVATKVTIATLVALFLAMTGPAPPIVRAATNGAGRSTVAGCPVFLADNAWNTPIAALPVHTMSTAWLASTEAGSAALHPDFGSDPSVGIPFTVVPAAQAGMKVRFDEAAEESDKGGYPIPPLAPIEAGDDRHLLIVQRSRCRLYELFNARKTPRGWVAGSGAIFDLRSNRVRPKGWTSADAAGLPVFPGLVRYDEVRSGAILHALRVTFPRTQKGFVFPARHHAGSDDASLPPMGARLRLRADVDLSTTRGSARVILQALKTYGLIVADNGSGWFVSGAPDPRWDDDDLRQLKKVDTSRFEFVESGPIER